MPRVHLGVLASGALVTGAALIVLYVIRASPVHVSAAAPPPSLSAMIPDSVPKPAPSATFSDAAGRPVSLASFKGHVVILNLWARWCAPCVRELPALGRLAAALGPERLTIVAIDEGRDNAAGSAAFLRAHGAANLAVYRDSGLALLLAFGAQGLPFSVLIDARGNEIARASGPLAWDDPAAIAYFRALGTPNRAP
ncbi:MAG: TlpA family protein disulfide reductase [Rhizomicrobium sp.]